jgi:hypothetical protein
MGSEWTKQLTHENLPSSRRRIGKLQSREKGCRATIGFGAYRNGCSGSLDLGSLRTRLPARLLMARTRSVRTRVSRRHWGEEQTRSWQGRTDEVDPSLPLTRLRLSHEGRRLCNRLRTREALNCQGVGTCCKPRLLNVCTSAQRAPPERDIHKNGCGPRSREANVAAKSLEDEK